MGALRLPNGTFKTTSNHRLTNVDDAICEALHDFRLGGPTTSVRALDVAISSGVTTLDWKRTLERDGWQVEVAGLDRYLNAPVVSGPLGTSLLALADGYPLHFHLPLVTITRDRFHLRGRLRPVISKYLVSPGTEEAEGRSATKQGAAYIRLASRRKKRRMWRSKPVLLVDPRVANDSQIHLIEADLLADVWIAPGTFDVVRAANLLNRGYFEDRLIRLALRRLMSCVGVHGLLVIAQTHVDGANHATAVRREGGTWKVQFRVGGGADIEDLLALSTIGEPEFADTRRT